ncbi:MAG: YqgE/AlgH family protein [Flavobacteriales bacterium AspAUS03]
MSNSKEIYEVLYWAGSYEDVRMGINIHNINADEIQFYLGYSKWDTGQLKRELHHYV